MYFTTRKTENEKALRLFLTAWRAYSFHVGSAACRSKPTGCRPQCRSQPTTCIHTWCYFGHALPEACRKSPKIHAQACKVAGSSLEPPKGTYNVETCPQNASSPKDGHLKGLRGSLMTIRVARDLTVCPDKNHSETCFTCSGAMMP